MAFGKIGFGMKTCLTVHKLQTTSSRGMNFSQNAYLFWNQTMMENWDAVAWKQWDCNKRCIWLFNEFATLLPFCTQVYYCLSYPSKQASRKNSCRNFMKHYDVDENETLEVKVIFVLQITLMKFQQYEVYSRSRDRFPRQFCVRTDFQFI